MYRQSQLIQAYKKVLKTYARHDAPTTRRNYYQVMRQITNDLTTLNHLPYSWDTLTRTQLNALIAYWRGKAQSVHTIANKLSILRGFFKRASDQNPLPTNAHLGLTWITPQKNLLPPENVIARLHHPWVKTLIEFEWHFGLLFRESARLLTNVATTHNQLHVYSDAAAQHQGRFVPIVLPTQRHAIRSRLALLDNSFDLTQLGPLSILKALYRAELNSLGIKGEPHFRRAYITQRYHALCAQQYLPNDALAIVRHECGMASDQPLRRLIQTDQIV